MGDALKALVSGAMVMAYLVAGLFFLRFWRDTRDRLFAIFAGAFWLLAVQRAVLTIAAHQGHEGAVWIYSLRLLAFLLILVAIIDKNRSS
jgi:amino acid transporter